MEEAFEKLKSEGKNNVDNLVNWMKDSKIVEDTQEATNQARSHFSKVKDQANVLFSEFKEAITSLASSQKKKFEDLAGKMATVGPSAIADAAKNAANAVVNAFK